MTPRSSFVAVATVWLGSGCATDLRPARGPDIDTGERDVFDEPIDTGDTDTGADTDTEDTIDPGAAVDQVCFLGPVRDHSVCFPVVAPAVLPGGYDYPSGFNGDPNYRPPVAFLDLDTLDGSQGLAPNFLLEEAAQPWKGRFAIVQPHAIERLQELRDDLGPLVVNSGYRNPDYNASVGGATYSRHQYGDAFDLDPASVTLDALESRCRTAGAGYVGVYATHIHCDWRDDAVDPAFYGPVSRSGGRAPIPRLEARLQWHGETLTAPAVGWDEGEPLREWTAFDPAGTVLATAAGADFAPPVGTDRVEVVVGRALTVVTSGILASRED